MSRDAFEKWFLDSAVVDTQGQPLIVYHGTTAPPFEAFRPHVRRDEQLGFGIHFTEDDTFAMRYAHNPDVARRGKHPRVIAAYLSVQKPLFADKIVMSGSPEFALAQTLAGRRLLTQAHADGRKMAYLQGAIDATSPSRAERLIREAGYDGVCYRAQIGEVTPYGKWDRGPESRSWVVFEPHQVKTVDNVGTWSPADPRMRHNAVTFESLPDGRLVGWRAARYQGGYAVSGADSRQRARLRRGEVTSFTGAGMFLANDRQYVIDYYAGHDQNVVMRYAFRPEDVVRGSLEDAQAEVSVREAELLAFEVLRNNGLPDVQRTTWYHLTDKARFQLDSRFSPADNTIAMEDRSGRPGIYLAPDVEKWVNGHGYWRPFVVEVTVDPGVFSQPGVSGRWGGELFVPASLFGYVKVARVIPLDAYAREHFGTHGWIEEWTGREFDTKNVIPRRGSPGFSQCPFRGYKYPGPDVREMPLPEVQRLKRDLQTFRRSQSRENPSPPLHGVFYHGTPTRAAANGILAHGIRPGTTVQGRRHMDPVAGRVYLTPTLSYAVTYALGGDVAGHQNTMRGQQAEPYGFVFVAPAAALSDIQPDEDFVGELAQMSFEGPDYVQRYYPRLAGKVPVWMRALAQTTLTPRQLMYVKGGEYIWLAAAGKKLLKVMTDRQKQEVIDLGASVASRGVVIPSECWRIEKSRSSELARDGSNFFDVAERVWP